MGRTPTPYPVDRVALRGRYACCGGPALMLVDVGDPARPVVLGHTIAEPHEGTYGARTGTTGLFLDVRPFERDGKEYVAAVDHYWGLRLYDVTDAGHPNEVGDFATSGGDFTGIQAAAGRVDVGNNWGGVSIIDTTDPRWPFLAGSTRRIRRPNRGSVGLIGRW